MKLSAINKDRRLYVLSSGAAYSCFGFDVLNIQAIKCLEWLKSEGRAAELLLGAKGIDVQSLSIPARVGTKKHFHACTSAISAAGTYAATSGEHCDLFLTDQLKGLEGRRVEVVDRHGEQRRFIVGVSSGWMRTHLEIATRRSSGGCSVTGAPFQSVSVVG